MILNHFLPISRTNFSNYSRRFLGTRCSISRMGSEMTSLGSTRKHSNFRIINVSGYKADLLEIDCQDPTFHVLFIPGNPGVISFYTEFLESLFELLGGTARVTAIGHVSHTQKNWESGRLFSLQEQIEHKISFIEHVFQDALPIVLVGHSIGSHISLELFRRYEEKVIYCICLYPFLAMDAASSKQATIRRIALSPALSTGLSSLVAFLGFLPGRFSRFIAKKILGKSCSSFTVEVLCTHVLKYHVMRNMLFMAKTEFEKLPEKPDFDFIGGNKSKLGFLFGSDDHWAPLRLYEEIYEKVPDATLAIEREGHTHAFSCTDAGSTWVAQHVCSLIKKHLPNDILFHN
ncbi:uncharacterized protein [Primulina eburnea]|uniref:uncharacterized protein isoform X1 n=1 Tax=Primulina eburnea TaxID=1245227 RepID=UPI003C6C9C52